MFKTKKDRAAIAAFLDFPLGVSHVAANTAEKSPAASALDPNRKSFTTAQAAVYLERGQAYIRKAVHDSKLKVDGEGRFIFERSALDKLRASETRSLGPYRKGTRKWVADRHAKNRVRKSPTP